MKKRNALSRLSCSLRFQKVIVLVAEEGAESKRSWHSKSDRLYRGFQAMNNLRRTFKVHCPHPASPLSLSLMRQNLSEKEMAELTEEIRAGKKIQAIGIYRQATGEGLKESKKAVEEIEIMLHEKYPDQFPARKGRGCSFISGVGCLLVGLVLFFTLKP